MSATRQGALAAVLLGWVTPSSAEPPRDPSPQEIHQRAVIVDLHADTPFHLARRRYSLRKRLSFNQIDVPRMKAGNLAAQFFVLWPPASAVRAGRAARFCRKALAAIRKAAAESGAIEFVTSPEELFAVRARKRIGAFLAIEGADCLSGRVSALSAWRQEGVRYLGLTWNRSNVFATAAADRRHRRRGLTDAGVALVAEAKRLGVLVDVSHASERTFWDVVRVARAPFIASHSSAAALRRHRRNIDDEQARAIARAGGVVGVNFYRRFLKRRGRVTVDDVAAHVAHLVSVAGEDHVALGSDFDGLIRLPEGLRDPSDLPNLTTALRKRGLAPGAIAKVLGANVLRVLGNASADVQKGPRLIPLSPRGVRPRRARRLFDRSDLTMARVAGAIRGWISGPVSHVALVPCSPAGKVTLSLTRNGTSLWRHSLELRGQRAELPLPKVLEGRLRFGIEGASCLREVTWYGS